MTFNRRVFFYLFLVSLAAASCSSAKSFLRVENPPRSDYLPPGPQAEAYYHFLMGQRYQQRGQMDKALQHFQQALEKDPASPYLNTNLAAIYLKQGAPEKALLQAEKAIQADPKYIQAYLLLGGLYLSTNRRDKAIQTYQTILQIDPKSQEALLFLGTLNAEAKTMSRPSLI